MKRLFTLTLTLALALLLCSCALAEGLDFASMTDEELQTVIDTARNELTNRQLIYAENTVLIDQDGIKLYLSGKNDFRLREESAYLELGTVLVNDSDKNVSILVDDLYVNGWRISALGGGHADAGKKDKSTLDMNLFEAEITAFEDIEEMEFTFRVYDSDSYDDILVCDPITVQFK